MNIGLRYDGWRLCTAEAVKGVHLYLSLKPAVPANLFFIGDEAQINPLLAELIFPESARVKVIHAPAGHRHA